MPECAICGKDIQDGKQRTLHTARVSQTRETLGVQRVQTSRYRSHTLYKVRTTTTHTDFRSHVYFVCAPCKLAQKRRGILFMIGSLVGGSIVAALNLRLFVLGIVPWIVILYFLASKSIDDKLEKMARATRSDLEHCTVEVLNEKKFDKLQKENALRLHGQGLPETLASGAGSSARARSKNVPMTWAYPPITQSRTPQPVGNVQNIDGVPPASTVQKALAVLEEAYLVRDDEKLEKSVNDALDLIAAKGDSGINVLLERLYRDMRIEGYALVVKPLGDMAWNEWLKKRSIVDAVGRARAQSAIELLIPLLHTRSTDSQFYSILQPAVAKTLGAIGDKRAIEALRKALDDSSTRPMTKSAAANALAKVEEKPEPSEDEDGAMRPANTSANLKICSVHNTVMAYDVAERLYFCPICRNTGDRKTDG